MRILIYANMQWEGLFPFDTEDWENLLDLDLEIDSIWGENRDLNLDCSRAGWNIERDSIRLRPDNKGKYLYLEVSRYWVEFRLPDFFKKFVNFVCENGFANENEDPELWKFYTERDYRLSLTEKYNSSSVRWTFRDKDYVYRDSPYCSKVNVEFPSKEQLLKLNEGYEESAISEYEFFKEGVFNVIEADLEEISLKVIKSFDVFHKEKFYKKEFMKPYFQLEMRFMRDFFAGKRVWAQPKAAFTDYDVVQVPHMLSPGKIYPGKLDNMYIEHMLSWD